MEKIYLNTKEVCQMFGISPSKLYKMTYKNEIPVYRIGRLLKFKKLELIQFFELKQTPQIDEKSLSNLEYLRVPSLAA